MAEAKQKLQTTTESGNLATRTPTTTNGANENGPSTATPLFQLQRCYLKDLSLEQPNSPEIFLERGEPKNEIQIEINHVALTNENFYEITITGTVTSKIADKTLYLIEIKQAGIFEIRNLAPEVFELALNINAPASVYAYARANLSDVLVRAGFPPLYLTELNFPAIYEERKKQVANQQASELSP